MDGVAALLGIAHDLGCPRDQMENFLSSGYVPQPKQLEFHAACRSCDLPDGPDQIGFGGARGPGKSHAGFAQLALDDCRRFPGLKALYLRKVGKQAREQFEDLRRSVLKHVEHDYNRNAGIVSLWDDARIFIGHFKDEKDVDNYLGIEYDLILIEETTTLSTSKYQTLRDSNRSSKPGWRPRIYNTTNPGNIGHGWYKRRFILPARTGAETWTRFIPATIDDNAFIDADYKRKLEENTRLAAAGLSLGDWDIAAGMYFSTWRENVHVIEPFEIPADWPMWAGFDYGFVHPTVAILFTRDGDGHTYAIAEHVRSRALPSQHVGDLASLVEGFGRELDDVWPWAAGSDCFIRKQSKDTEAGETIADQYAELGLMLSRANVDRVNGAARLLDLLGDVDADPPLPSRFSVFSTCGHLIEQIPGMIHNPNRPEDVLKVDVDDDGNGGDDAYDAARYGLMVDSAGATASVAVGAVDPVVEMDGSDQW